MLSIEHSRKNRKPCPSAPDTQSLHGDWLQWMMCVERQLDQDAAPVLASSAFPESVNLKGVSF